MIETVQYKQWISTDRSTLETITKSADDFVESFCEQLTFVAKQQSTFQMEVRDGLKSGVFQVIADFSENYSFILQDENRGFIGTIHKLPSISLLFITQNHQASYTT